MDARPVNHPYFLSTVVKENRGEYSPIKFENSSEFSDQDYFQLNRKIDFLEKYYRQKLEVYSSRLVEVQKVLPKTLN